MKRIICCWELGGGYGHLYAMLPFLLEFKRLGHEIVAVVNNLTRAELVFDRHDIKILQAPAWRAPERSFPISLNYAQNLLRNGYWHGPSLRGNLKAWLNLFDVWKPDLVFVDHSPTALLAARSVGLPRAAFGNGFLLPPLLSPMPSLQPWFHVPERALYAKETELLSRINGILKEMDFNVLERVADLFEGADIFLTTFPEFDHYGPRPGAEYWGPIFSMGNETGSIGNERKKKGIFVYLNYKYIYLKEIFDHLRKLDLPVFAFIRDMPEESSDILGGKNIKFSFNPLDLVKVAKQCDFVITHGGVNTGSFMLLSEKAPLILPQQLEQNLWAHRITEQKMALKVNWFRPRPDFEKKLGELLDSQIVVERIAGLAQKYKDYESRDTVQKICQFLL